MSQCFLNLFIIITCVSQHKQAHTLIQLSLLAEYFFQSLFFLSFFISSVVRPAKIVAIFHFFFKLCEISFLLSCSIIIIIHFFISLNVIQPSHISFVEKFFSGIMKWVYKKVKRKKVKTNFINRYYNKKHNIQLFFSSSVSVSYSCAVSW